MLVVWCLWQRRMINRQRWPSPMDVRGQNSSVGLWDIICGAKTYIFLRPTHFTNRSCILVTWCLTSRTSGPNRFIRVTVLTRCVYWSHIWWRASVAPHGHWGWYPAYGGAQRYNGVTFVRLFLKSMAIRTLIAIKAVIDPPYWISMGLFGWCNNNVGRMHKRSCKQSKHERVCNEEDQI